MLARNTMVQLLALYTNPESHIAHSTVSQTDGRTYTGTDKRQAYANGRYYCVAVLSPKNAPDLVVFPDTARSINLFTYLLDLGQLLDTPTLLFAQNFC